MKSLRLLVVPAFILSSLSACSARNATTPPPATNSPVVVVGQDSRGVAVLGHGEIVAIPDTALIDVGIETHGVSVAAARASGAKAMNALIASVTRNGVARPDIQTSQLSLSPRYDYDKPGGEGRITGYTMTTSVSVRVRNLDKLSAIVDDAIAAGGNASRVSGIRFSVEDAVALRDRARESAIADARRKAEQIAKVSGSKLGSLIAIEEVAAQMPPMPILAEADVSRTPIERGSATVTVEVRARWAIAG